MAFCDNSGHRTFYCIILRVTTFLISIENTWTYTMSFAQTTK